MRLPKGVLPAAFVSGLILVPILFLGHVRFYSARSRLPEMGVQKVAFHDLRSPVEVAIDDRGIPYIEARHEEDLWFAQGYVHACDRFFQMEMLRRRANGTLAEVFGETAMPDDQWARTLRLASTAHRQAVDLDGRDRKILTSYAAGVNSALQRYESWIAPETWLLGIEPERWKVTDTLAIVMLTQTRLSRSMIKELERSVELTQLGRDRVEQLWGWSRRQSRRWIPPVEAPAGALDVMETFESVTAASTLHWALSGSRTESRRPLLASVPGFEGLLPGIWYAVGLRAPGLHATGVSIAGIPGVLMGHNRQVAWSYGPSHVDDQDVFVVTLDESRSRELTGGQWIPIRTVAEEITVRWRDQPEILKVRMSMHGPVLREGPNGALVLTWAAHQGPSPVGAFLGGMRAESSQELAELWSETNGPAMSLVAADVGGHLVHQFVGKMPNRGSGAGRLPAPGDQERWAWQGMRAFPASTRSFDPGSGVVVASGHDPFAEGDFPTRDAVAGEYDPPWRIRRARAKLESSETWTVGGCLELQQDVVSGRAVAMLKALWPDFQRHQGTTAQALLAWDGSMDVDRAEPHIFLRLVEELRWEAGFDEAVQARLDESPVSVERLLRLLVGGIDERWWDDVGSQAVEGRAETVDRCLDRLDAMPEAEAWGDVHGIRFRHALADVPLVGSLIGNTRKQRRHALAGDAHTLDASTWNEESPFDVMSMPTMRFVADVGDWDRSVLVLPSGQSGRPWSTSYGVRLREWRSGEARELPFSRAAIEAAARAHLVMEPQAQRR